MKVHHVGIVVPSIEAVLDEYTAGLGFTQATQVVFDPEQDCRLVLLTGAGDVAGIELIEPASDDSPVARLAKRGGGYAHICYQVGDLDAEVARLRERGAVLVQKPTPAVLFDGRRVAFMFLRSRQLIELVEEPAADQ